MGLIPAGAGNTSAFTLFSDDTGAHPRRRGEHGHPVAYYAVAKGSSPQARGTHKRQGGQVAQLGLIPAGAGNTEVTE